MSLTATISTSAPDSCAARKTLRPMRPKPLIPTRTGMAMKPFPWQRRTGRSREGYLGACGRAVHVAVLNLHQQARVVAEVRAQILGDHDRPVAPAGAADGDHEMRLPLGDVLGQEV